MFKKIRVFLFLSFFLFFFGSCSSSVEKENATFLHRNQIDHINSVFSSESSLIDKVGPDAFFIQINGSDNFYNFIKNISQRINSDAFGGIFLDVLEEIKKEQSSNVDNINAINNYELASKSIPVIFEELFRQFKEFNYIKIFIKIENRDEILKILSEKSENLDIKLFEEKIEKNLCIYIDADLGDITPYYILKNTVKNNNLQFLSSGKFIFDNKNCNTNDIGFLKNLDISNVAVIDKINILKLFSAFFDNGVKQNLKNKKNSIESYEDIKKEITSYNFISAISSRETLGLFIDFDENNNIITKKVYEIEDQNSLENVYGKFLGKAIQTPYFIHKNSVYEFSISKNNKNIYFYEKYGNIDKYFFFRWYIKHFFMY